MFSGKEIPSFLMIQEGSYSSAILWEHHLCKTFKKKYGFSCSVGQICAILTMTGNTWLKLVLIVRNKKFMMLGSLYIKHDFVRSIMFS